MIANIKRTAHANIHIMKKKAELDDLIVKRDTFVKYFCGGEKKQLVAETEK